jgi:hypothetical protein
MRRRLILGAIASAVVVAVVVLVATAGSDDSPPAPTNARGLQTRTVSAGEIDIKIEPLRLDVDGAAFAITLDTHSVELSSNLTADARLEVAGTEWPVTAWEGDGPGGHHRAGTLEFDATGPVTGSVRLTVAGFGEPVEAAWELGT